MAPTRILVTGADGFIGSHVAEHLIRDGHQVRALIFYNSFDSWGWLDHVEPALRGSFEVFPGDIRDPHGVMEAMRGCEVVMHLAALIGIPYSYHAPDNYVDTNIKGTLNVLQAARALGVARVIHTSTSEVYGTAQSVPITEEHRVHPQSPYAATKAAADQLALSFQASFATPVTVLRPFNTFGPRQSTRAVIPTIITQIASKAKRVKLGSLHPTRDFCFVKDTVRAYVAAINSDQAVGEVINVATGHEISVGDTARLIARLMSADIEIVAEARRVRPDASEVERLCGDNAKAKRLLGWAPEFGGPGGLRKGIEETIAWFENAANLARYKPGTYTL
ncbi:MAG TPA: NAD-dependent 4,6-dehydratase LegB [Burkholderiales bacterium]|nr:NAD-dependent 4,6-dehydratase LegB [Burkholderiales bacterium]